MPSPLQKLSGAENAPPKSPRKRRHVKEAKKKLRTVSELRQLAAAHGVEAPVSVGALPDVLDEVLRRAVADFRFAASQVDELTIDEVFVTSIDAQGNVVHKPHWWVEAERFSREEVTDIASRLSGLDLDARRVALAEAQATLLQRALRTAIESVGLTPEQRLALGPALRAARELMTNTTADIDDALDPDDLNAPLHQPSPQYPKHTYDDSLDPEDIIEGSAVDIPDDDSPPAPPIKPARPNPRRVVKRRNPTATPGADK